MSVEDAGRSGDAEGNDGRDERQRRRQQLREVQGQWLQKPVVGRQKQRLKRDSRERQGAAEGMGWSWLRERGGAWGGRDSAEDEAGLKEGVGNEETGRKKAKTGRFKGKTARDCWLGKGEPAR